MCNYIPAGHRVIIKLDPVKDDISIEDEEITTESGIKFYVPKNNDLKKDKQVDEAATDRGTIVAIGAKAWFGCHDGEAWAKVGDKVVFMRYAGNFLKTENQKEKLRVVEDTDILAIIKE